MLGAPFDLRQPPGSPRSARPLLPLGFLLSCLLLVPFAIPGSSQTAPASKADGIPPGPSLVIIGGALESSNTPIYEAILERRLPGRPICVLPTASAEPRASMESYLADFHALGGSSVAEGILLRAGERHRLREPALLRRLEKVCGGFFFTGGDQSRIVDLLRPNGDQTAASRAILRVFQAGGVIAGTSAGAAMMSDPMIGGGQSAEALEYGAVSKDGEPGVWLRNGMGYLPDVLVDQHFLARGRLGRLLVAMQSEGRTLGFGIDENTALVIDGLSSALPGGPHPVATVIGASGVLAVDASSAIGNQGRDSAEAPDHHRWYLWLLADGDRFHLGSRRVEPAEKHAPITASSDARDRLSEPFEGDALHRALIELARSTDTSLRLGKRSSGMEVGKGPGFRAAETDFESSGSRTGQDQPQQGEERRTAPLPIFAGPYELFWQVPGASTDG